MKRRSEPKKNKKIECPNCNSTNILYRKKDQMFWCRKCGQEFRVRKASKYKPVSKVSASMRAH